MAEFDFSKLMEDPKFVAGLSILGAANPRMTPLLAGLQAYQGMQKTQRDIKKEEAQNELFKQRSSIYEQQVKQAQSQADLQRRTLEGVSKYLSGQGIQIPGLGGDGMDAPPVQQMIPQGVQQDQEPMIGGPMPPQQGMPAPLSPMSQGQGRPQGVMSQQPPNPIDIVFDTKIIQAESGGKQFRAPGIPLISPKGAVGISQVMPTTGPEAAALAGLPWDKNALYFDAEYNKKLGKAYFKKQAEDFGDPAYAAAAYNAGPERTRKAIDLAAKMNRPEIWASLLPKETQDYVKSTVGSTVPTTAPEPSRAPPQSPLGLTHKGMPLVLAGAALGLAGMKGASGITELGKAMEPKSVTAGSYQQDPTTGKMTYIADPTEQRKAATEQTRLGLEERRVVTDEQRAAAESERAKASAEKATQETNVEHGKAYQAITNVNSNMDRLYDNAKKLYEHPGLKMITGVTGGLISPRLLGEDARNAAALLETLKAQTFIQGTTALRAASATGAGVGNQSDKEGDKLEASQARLSQAQSLPEFKAALKEVMDLTKGAKSRMTTAYEASFPGKKYAAPRTITRTGRDKSSGKKVIQYSDGSVEYAD